MKLFSLSTQTLTLWLSGITVLSVGSSLWLVSPLQPATATTSETTAWQLTAVNEADITEQYAQLQNLTRWQLVEPPKKDLPASLQPADEVEKSGAEQALAWQFLGTVYQGQQAFVLINDKAAQKIQKYKVNEMLPDETRIKSIQSDRVVVEKAGELTTFTLYAIEPS